MAACAHREQGLYKDKLQATKNELGEGRALRVST